MNLKENLCEDCPTPCIGCESLKEQIKKLLSKLEEGDRAIEKLEIAKKNFAIIERIINDENKILSKIAAEEMAQEKLNQIDNVVNDFCPDCREVRCIIRSD